MFSGLFEIKLIKLTVDISHVSFKVSVFMWLVAANWSKNWMSTHN